MATIIQKVLLIGKSRTSPVGRRGSASAEDHVDIQLSSPQAPQQGYTFEDVQPHPTAEQLFAGAWSACYITALSLIAKQKKVELPPDLAIELEVDLGVAGSAYLLQARLNVLLPGLPQDVADEIAHAADEICPYSKATRGNVEVSLSVVTR